MVAGEGKLLGIPGQRYPLSLFLPLSLLLGLHQPTSRLLNALAIHLEVLADTLLKKTKAILTFIFPSKLP